MIYHVRKDGTIHNSIDGVKIESESFYEVLKAIMEGNNMTRGQRKRAEQKEARREFLATMAGAVLAVGCIWVLMAVFATI